ncbi:hypothetical protein PVK06_037452 [Gossypium arboreum]|uniref:Uncharacterized protein n=1 Tax=Gossypium arboreum TaxID=29729 RepID=A0ABR0MXB6_GOSAR|nr:hypothetical protein PVK06_037452 [Gossypium arboreum]
MGNNSAMEEVISYPVLTVGGYKENEAMAWHSESQLSPTTATIQPSSNHQKHTNRGHNLTPLSTFPPPLFFPLTTGRKESEVAKIPTAFGVPSST